jgi:hypothetical protein
MAQPRELSVLQRAIALHAQNVMGERAEIYTYGSEDGKLELPVIVAPDNPTFGVSTYATIGLADHPQPNYGSNVQLELIGACQTDVTEFGEVLSSCVFECLKHERPINYGVVFENIVGQYSLSETMQHVTFVAPSLWEDFTKVRFLQLDVLWLMAIPVSASEVGYLRAHGIDALETRLEVAAVDITDINRPSVI